MKRFTNSVLRGAAALVFTAASLSAVAQTPSTTGTEPIAPDTSASAAATAKPQPVPRLLTPTESRDKTAIPGDLRPERPVTPQVSIPVLGRSVPASPSIGAARPSKSGTPGVIDDAAARCNAEAEELARAKCRDGLLLAGERPPN